MTTVETKFKCGCPVTTTPDLVEEVQAIDCPHCAGVLPVGNKADYTCNECLSADHGCPFAWDEYNKNGDCLGVK